MTWYRVPVYVWLQADDETAAIQAILDKLRGMMVRGGPAEERTGEQMQPLFDLEEKLNEAAADADAGLMVEVGGFPGVKFSPQAAAELAALRFEKDQP
jgi:hypothetical protein